MRAGLLENGKTNNGDIKVRGQTQAHTQAQTDTDTDTDLNQNVRASMEM